MNIPKSGEGWNQLEEKVDSLVEALIEEKSLPGVTVAVTKGGRLLLSKGYGYTLVDGTRKLPMKPCSRSRIGSVTKAVVTGPSAYQLAKSKNIDPKTQRLYGPNGFFGGMFDADIEIGIKTHASKSAKWREWYRKITMQHLLDHRAGFARSGDTEGAAKMFGVSEDQLTYEQVHRHFLRTRELRYEPGTNPPEGLDPYSNHGFGLWTVLIQKMSGKSYLDYVLEDYLKPMKLHNAVQPERANPASCDAYNHKFNSNQKPEVFPFEEHGLGLAAGGFRSSAQDLVRLTVSLDKKYTTAELDSMGWGMSSKGKLGHGGATGGGKAYVAMFSEGYISDSGANLSEVHVAVVTNIGGGNDDHLSSSNLSSLADKIALAVPASNVPITFDLWKQENFGCSCEYVRYGVPANQYQQVFDEAVQSGYQLEWIDGYTNDGKTRFNVIFRTNDQGIAWVSRHNMTGTTYQQNFDRYRDEGFSLTHVDSYVVGNDVLYAAIWTKGGGAYTAYHGKSREGHQNSFDSLTSEGWKPKVISVASVGGQLRYTALYTKQAIGSFEARSFLTPDEYQTKFDQNKASGRHPYYLNSYLHEGKLRFSAIWAEKPEVSAYRARHGLTAGQFRTHWEDAMSDSFRTQAITGCEEDGKVQYAAYWTK